nr:putative transmembrane protein [Burkholderia pseudomallei]
MSTLAALFVTILLLNLAPAFAPPTWMAMSWLGFSRPGDDPLLMALVAASAATSGRLMLAKASRSLVRGRWMSDADRRNVDVAKAWIERRRRVTAWALLAYAFSPLPSNYLFIAYGLTGLPLRLIGVPFFFGRLASYALWASLGQFTHDYVEPESRRRVSRPLFRGVAARVSRARLRVREDRLGVSAARAQAALAASGKGRGRAGQVSVAARFATPVALDTAMPACA